MKTVILPKMTYHPKSIAETGLAVFLEETRSKHNDYGYADFDKFVKAKIGPVNIAKAFKVDYRRAKAWMDIYWEELKRSKQTIIEEPVITAPEETA